MRKTSKAASKVEDIAWLSDVREIRHPLSQCRPLWVREMDIHDKRLPNKATLPHPEWHACCEISYIFRGRLLQYVGAEKVTKTAGDIMLLGPGTPHFAEHLIYPLRYITVFFLPALLFELGPNGDGARALTRFIGSKTTAEFIVRPPFRLRRVLADRFEQIAAEFARNELGSELRLRSLLIDNLVDILRWESSVGRLPNAPTSELNWHQLEKALRFIHEHYAKPIYVAEIARDTGLSVARLQELFKRALGMTCIKYLLSYRISHAAALLRSTDERVTTIAFDVGFETLGHFNASFRSILGSSPREYRLARRQNRQ